MKIGIEATSAVEAHKTGVGAYTANLIRVMAQLPRVHTYTFYLRDAGKAFNALQQLTNSPPPRQILPPPQLINTPTYQLANSSLLAKPLACPYLWAQARLPLELWQCRQSVYFFPAPVLPLLYQPGRSVITVHDVAFLFFPQCFAPLLRFWLRTATWLGAIRARAIIAVSEATRQDLLAHYKLPPDKVRVVRHGVDERYRPLAATPAAQQHVQAVRQRYQIHDDYLLFVGTLQQRKNIPRLLQAFARLKQHTDIPHKLVLVGRAHPDLPEPDIQAAIERLDLRQEVILTGYIADEDMPLLFNGAALFVFPSLYEGFGMPVLEAMACGVPTVCARTSSLPEVVGAGGMMFDPTNVDDMATTMYRGLTDAGLRTRLREHGLRRARLFSWYKCARQTLAVLEDAADA